MGNFEGKGVELLLADTEGMGLAKSRCCIELTFGAVIADNFYNLVVIELNNQSNHLR